MIEPPTVNVPPRCRTGSRAVRQVLRPTLFSYMAYSALENLNTMKVLEGISDNECPFFGQPWDRDVKRTLHWKLVT